MDFEQLITQAANFVTEHNNGLLWGFIAYIFLAVFFRIYRKIRNIRLIRTVTSLRRGTRSERQLILKLLKKKVHPQTIFHDLIVQKGNGEFAQIDIVIATKEGIIVIEVKDYSGSIYGDGNHSQWTQVMANGKQKYRFYNPIMQNQRHIEALKKQLKQFENIPFYSIIAFYGNCNFKEINYVPKGTYLVKSHRIMEVMKLIRKNNEEAPYTNKRAVLNVLHQAVKKGKSSSTQNKHIENVNEMLGQHRIYD